MNVMEHSDWNVSKDCLTVDISVNVKAKAI